MAICSVCRFYSYTLEQVKELTMDEFQVLNDCMIEIIEMENTTPESDKPKPLTSASMVGIAKKKPKGK
ncbi:MAG: hypothetical protein KAX49_15750 [Halanaerobiales bacterium]|nr:hypothetical protein [Halanaerobiales bacterium]